MENTFNNWYQSGGLNAAGQAIIASYQTGESICIVYKGDENAALIAAAPDLYAELKNLIDLLADQENTKPVAYAMANAVTLLQKINK